MTVDGQVFNVKEQLLIRHMTAQLQVILKNLKNKHHLQKGCRPCTTSAIQMKTQFQISTFQEYDLNIYLGSYDILDNLADTKANGKYWCKVWGINNRSL